MPRMQRKGPIGWRLPKYIVMNYVINGRLINAENKFGVLLLYFIVFYVNKNNLFNLKQSKSHWRLHNTSINSNYMKTKRYSALIKKVTSPNTTILGRRISCVQPCSRGRWEDTLSFSDRRLAADIDIRVWPRLGHVTRNLRFWRRRRSGK